MSRKIPVYDDDGRIVSRVNRTTNLDFWDGRNWTSGSAGHHMGITRLKDGRYVLIYISQWQGERDSAEIVSDEEALEAILRTGHEELLDEPRFHRLRELAESTLVEEDIGEEEE